jgi:UDP-N-acetylglucosamine 2-epimerase (non-hydrolysing)
MIAFEQLLLEHRPRLVIVAGDVNSTLACALAAAKCGIPVAHVEAGLRSFDRTMPEELNRVLVDSISDICFTTCTDANDNLASEGIARSRVFYVGNTMIDSLLRVRPCARRPLMLPGHEYILVTAHRPSNVDTRESAATLLEMLRLLSYQRTVLFPIHPRTLEMVKKHALCGEFYNIKEVVITPPFTYSEFIYTTDHAALAVTDSGGVQEETSALGVPCITIRNNTERPITVRAGTNHIVGLNPQAVAEVAATLLAKGRPNKKPIHFWDGHAAARITDVLWEGGYCT